MLTFVLYLHFKSNESSSYKYLITLLILVSHYHKNSCGKNTLYFTSIMVKQSPSQVKKSVTNFSHESGFLFGILQEKV